MAKSILLVIAGCNGAGKSSFSSVIVPDTVTPFDYDKHFLNYYNSKSDSDLRELMSHNQTRELLDESVKEALAKKLDFCYETNFNADPFYWPNIFQKEGYELRMIYFCLDSMMEAKNRVRIRYENGGHFVPDHEVDERFNQGYLNLDNFFDKFDNVDLFNSSHYNKTPEHIISLSKGKITAIGQIPKFLEKILPKISNIIRLKLNQ